MRPTIIRPTMQDISLDLMPSLSSSNRYYVLGVTIFMKTDIIIAGTFLDYRNTPGFVGWRNKEGAVYSFSTAYEEKKVVPIYNAMLMKGSINDPIYNSKVSVVFVSLGEAIAVLPKPIKNSEWHKQNRENNEEKTND